MRAPLSLFARRLGPFASYCLAIVGLVAALPATAGAYATVAPEPVFSSASGLPDNRVYEQVSPTNKDGHEAGAGLGEGVEGEAKYSVAAAGGDAVMFFGTGALGQSTSGLNHYFVARRSPGIGWGTSTIMPREAGFVSLNGLPIGLDPSVDLTRLVFAVGAQGVYAPPPAGITGANLYLSEDAGGSSTWVGRPSVPGSLRGLDPASELVLVGGSPDLGAFYFAYAGTLLGEDEARVPYARAILNPGGAKVAAWGFYEYRDGELGGAGLLPARLGGPEVLDPRGAVPAGLAGQVTRSAVTPSALGDGEVSSDGQRAFFVSPDPGFCTEGFRPEVDRCVGDPPQLYVRETMADGGQRTVLVSRDELLAGVEGLPAGAPDGSAPYLSFFTAPDGSRAFFASRDNLTLEAREAEEAGDTSEVKTYEFVLGTGRLRYLPGVVGPIVTAAQDGSSFMFENTAASPVELDRWSSQAGVTPIVQLPGPGSPCEGNPLEFQNVTCVRPARTVAGGSVVVFGTAAPIAGFNNGGRNQIYRYDARDGKLNCVSCPPSEVEPSGDASLSHNFNAPQSAVDGREVSADGSRVFFDSTDPLVPRDTNGVRDVYMWENDQIFLISSGSSLIGSLLLDGSESGGDIFFATTAGLNAGDRDGAFDVYDARIPRPGDAPPAREVPCQGDVCQGPPSVPQLLSPPASATFSGLGNIGSPPQSNSAARPKPKASTNAKKLSIALKACKRQPKKKRARCRSRARTRYGSKSKARSQTGVASHGI